MTNTGLTGRHVLVGMLLFFAVIVSVNLTLAIIAIGSRTGLVVENGFVASQSFNRDQAAARRQAARGWTAAFGYRSGHLEFLPRDKSGQALSGFIVKVRLQRPATDREDTSAILGEIQSGRYAIALAIKPGRWDADVIATSPSGEAFRQIYRIHVAN